MHQSQNTMSEKVKGLLFYLLVLWRGAAGTACTVCVGSALRALACVAARYVVARREYLGCRFGGHARFAGCARRPSL